MTESAEEAAFRDAMNRAVRLLSGRNHTRVELHRKLKQKGVAEAVVREVIRECERLRYLDDRMTAGIYLEELRRKGYGGQRIRATMLRKGLEAGLVDGLLEESVEREDEVSSAARMLDKKRRTFERESDPRKRKEKMYRYLYGRGFSGSIISEVIGGFDDGWE